MHEHDNSFLHSEMKCVHHIGSEQYELKLLSSLNTLGYIEFDDLCNLNVLDDKLSIKYDMPCFSGKTFHVIGIYNDKGDHMVHRVYICSDHNVSCNKNEQCEVDGRIFTNLNCSAKL